MYERFDALIWFLVRKANPPSIIDKEDIVQEVWVRLLKDCRFDDEGVKTYIGLIVRSVIADELEKRDIPVESIEIAEDEGPEEMPAWVDDAIAGLSPKKRELLELKYIQGMTVKALAKHFHCSPERIKYRLELARLEARKLGGKL